MIDVLTHENRPPMADTDAGLQGRCGAREGSPFRPLYDDKIMFSGQPIALVVAEESEIARFAASLVRVEYDESRTSPTCYRQRDDGLRRLDEASRRSRAATPTKALAAAAVRHEAEYYVPIEHHNPMELFASTVIVGGRRQAHGLRQDPGRAERAALSLQRVRA